MVMGFSTYGYADDIGIIAHGKFTYTVRNLMQEALNVVVKWAVSEGLNISPHNTVIAPFTNRRNFKDLDLLYFMVRNSKCWERLSIWG